jgi:hypothetical protein
VQFPCHCTLLQAQRTACDADKTCAGCRRSSDKYLDYSTVKECTQAGVRAAFGSVGFLNTTACVTLAEAAGPLAVLLDCAAANDFQENNCAVNKFCSTPVSSTLQRTI